MLRRNVWVIVPLVMRQSLSLVLLVLCAGLLGCATSKKCPAVAASERTAGDLCIRSAVFGVGLQTADVTDRVAYLLRSEPEGFKAVRDWLHADPAPYSSKALVIDYDYKGRPYRIIIAGEKVKVTPELLIQNAQR